MLVPAAETALPGLAAAKDLVPEVEVVAVGAPVVAIGDPAKLMFEDGMPDPVFLPSVGLSWVWEIGVSVGWGEVVPVGAEG